ncbi:non-canonical purine NTP pyrophosphatase [Candidatus Peregrinibacteria bacterium]|nr:non-canonical purine NTP pyrophosphatase [Candidatus Peregrinibacteria bacterium]MBI3816688.1 non-canonical purine NTP pyrophosphatase [Candidatus Peregrinibacteria bacterium]
MHLLLGTNNRGKVIEIREALAGLPMKILTPEDVKIEEVPQERGSTFAENAIQKARFYFECSKIPTIADDSGIIVDALKHELGIHTRRWGAGPDANDEEWIAYFLDRMKKEDNKRASFVCTIAYIDASHDVHIFEGRCDGTITEELEATYLPGLPISGCFRPHGHDRVFSALNLDQKNRTSHRGKALSQLRGHLKCP